MQLTRILRLSARKCHLLQIPLTGLTVSQQHKYTFNKDPSEISRFNGVSILHKITTKLTRVMSYNQNE